jgi:hypothetical protein
MAMVPPDVAQAVGIVGVHEDVMEGWSGSGRGHVCGVRCSIVSFLLSFSGDGCSITLPRAFRQLLSAMMRIYVKRQGRCGFLDDFTGRRTAKGELLMPLPLSDVLLYATTGRGIGHVARSAAIGLARAVLYPASRVLLAAARARSPRSSAPAASTG